MRRRTGTGTFESYVIGFSKMYSHPLYFLEGVAYGGGLLGSSASSVFFFFV